MNVSVNGLSPEEGRRWMCQFTIDSVFDFFWVSSSFCFYLKCHWLQNHNSFHVINSHKIFMKEPTFLQQSAISIVLASSCCKTNELIILGRLDTQEQHA